MTLPKCWRCRGDGYFWICSVNPFLAGGLPAITGAMRKVDPCFECDGTGTERPTYSLTNGDL